jgi:UDP-glucose 4-epimerase
MSKMILVTGGAGYIGSHTALELQERGHQVVVLDNLTTGHRWAIRADKFIKGDVRDTALLTQIFERMPIDTVVHFAAKSVVSESITNPLNYYENNVVGAQRLIQATVLAGVPKFIFSSTAAVYGAPNSKAIVEKAVKCPINPYGRTKRMVELMLTDAFKANQLNSVTFRYFNAAGARPDAALGEIHEPETHLIPSILLSCLESKERTSLKVFGDDYPTPDGSCIRDYIHVKDLARAHADAIAFLDAHPGAHIMNLGAGKGYSVFDIINVCEATVAHKINYEIVGRRVGDPPTLVADASKALLTLGWSTRHSLPAIIEDSFKFLADYRRGF